MTNYEKIVKYIEAGFLVEVYNEDNNEYTLVNWITRSGVVIRSNRNAVAESCYYNRIYTAIEITAINKLNLKLTPVPRTVKEIKGKVQIIDFPELREIAKIDDWEDEPREMIGQKGLEIKEHYNNIDGKSYAIYTKDKSDYFYFPAQFAAPYFEDDKNEKLLKEIKELEEKVEQLKKTVNNN